MSIEQNLSSEIPRNAISVYQPDNAMDDFPVLKAFQQYIDAEQSKSRKRMVSLCIFFGVLMTVIVAVFMFMLHSVSSRNQQLNDRLVEYAMRDRDRQPVVMPQQPVPQANDASEAAMRAMTDTLVALQKQIAEQQRPQPVAAAPAAAAPAAVTPVAVAQEPSPEESELVRKTRAAEDKLRKARALLDAEKRKLAEEKERLRQEEVERHRRRLYPEYYGEKPAASSEPTKARKPETPPAQPAKKQLSDSDIADILREVDEAQSSLSATGGEDVIDDDIEEAIEYFSDEDYEAPAASKGTHTSKWHVPLD